MATKKTDTIIIPIEIDENGLNRLNDNINETVQVTKSLKSQLKEMTLELQGLEPGTARFYELTAAAGQLKDQINDTNAAIKATAGSATENLASGLGNVASVGISGFQGLASAAALFGGESNAVQQSLLKLQALAGLGDSIKSLGALGDTMTEIKASFMAAASQLGIFSAVKKTDTVITGAQTVATNGASIATRVLGATMNALPIFAIIAGLTAVVGAIMYFTSETETAEKANDDFNSSIEKTTSLLESQAEMSKLRADKSLELLQAQGASEEELHLKKLDNMAIEKYYRDNAITDEKYAIQEKTKFYRKALDEENYELAKKIQGEIKAHRDKYKDLIKQNSTYNTDILIENTKFNQEISAEEKENAEKAQQKRSEANKKRVSDLALIRKNETDAINSQKSEEEQALIAVRDKYKIQIDLATKYGKDVTNLIIAQKNAENEIILKSETEKLKIAEDAIIKKQEIDKKIIADNISKEDSEWLRYQELTLSKADYDKLVLQQKYDTENTAAEGNADLQLALKTKLEEDLKKIDDEATKNATENAKKVAEEKKKAAFAGAQAGADALNLIATISENNAKDDLNRQKKAFNIRKAANIAQATIDGTKAVLSTYADTPGGPIIKGIAAGISGAFAIAQIAKLSQAKFEGGGNISTTTIASPTDTSSTSTSAPATPQFNLFGSGGNQNNVGSNGPTNGEQNITVTAVVSETEMTNVQNKVKGIKTNAEL
jgi:hypothetical protein